MACIRVGDYKTGKFGYIDKSGKTVIDPIYSGAYFFNDGLACVSISPLTNGNLKNAKWQYIDKTGKLVITRGSDFFADFYKGLAYVSYEGAASYIDKTGKVVWGHLKLNNNCIYIHCETI